MEAENIRFEISTRERDELVKLLENQAEFLATIESHVHSERGISATKEQAERFSESLEFHNELLASLRANKNKNNSFKLEVEISVGAGQTLIELINSTQRASSGIDLSSVRERIEAKSQNIH